jgi:DNA-binding CsgD family transcriptional regulator
MRQKPLSTFVAAKFARRIRTAKFAKPRPNEDQSMSTHFTKPDGSVPSHISPSGAASVASDMTLGDTYVLLCDWHGRVVWKSGTEDRIAIGEEVWKHGAKQSIEQLRGALASVVALREECTIEVESNRGDHFRFWMWPLSEPEIAVCILALRIPGELALLTDRERACMKCLSQGKSTRDIADELEIGLTTVHTHLRRAREKLRAPSAEALIGLAARYFFASPPRGGSIADQSQVRTKRVP